MSENKDYKEKTEYLSKEEELELGRLIQAHFKAKKRLEEDENLTEAEVKELNETIKIGEQAVDTLVKANMGLVFDRARIFKNNLPSGPELQDLQQSGMIGLMNAIQKYDPDRGNKFSTMAYSWIGQAIARDTNKYHRLVRLPENRINDYGRINKIVNSLETENISQAEIDKKVMKELGLSKTDLINIRNAASTPASLNKVITKDSGGTKELMDFVGEQNVSASSERVMLSEEMNKILVDSIRRLDPIKQDIVSCMFSVDGVELTPETVRQKYNIQPFKFKKLQTEAFRELRQVFEGNGYTFEDFMSNN